jgi:hypothetical protein
VEEHEVPSEIENKLLDMSLDDFEVIVIDSCEYIAFKHYDGTHGYGFMAHKGNCTNPMHCNSEFTEVEN